ncbi:MAG TPA: UDP-glucose/GDP-mannose dehydrogenase family protein [Mesorhizobium sp.]|jgi:UDPglucose 6-dehydrogenase|nr:UDP-glucose/GDP-mannose dehydrogenase family protein [Mesorhizobium sp.]
MNIAIFGSGYVGLVTGACFADAGHRVRCVDIDETKIARLKRADIPIFEPGLSMLVRSNLDAGRLSFSTEAGDAVRNSDLLFIAVGTPPGEDGSADLDHVLAVARTIGREMDGPKVVVNKSTVPVGTADRVRATIAAALRERGADHGFEVCSNPEFLKEGSAIEDFMRAARIIVGTDSGDVRKLMAEVYAPYNRNHEKLMFMDARSAELTKYAANAMLATKISFINNIANIAESVGADIEEVRRGIGSDPRIGYHFIYPGCGYGGSCFPKDVRALSFMAREAGADPTLLDTVEAVNDRQKQVLFEKLSRAFDGDLEGRRIAVWGLAFKPNTDDMRDAPSRVLLEALWRAGATVQAHDPEAMRQARALFGDRPDLVLAPSREAAVESADALVVCTEWKQFRAVDFAWLKSKLNTPVVVDGRNLYNPDEVRRHGLLYFAVGRGDSVRRPAA